MQVHTKVSVDVGGINRLRSGARARVADVVAVAAHRIEARMKGNIVDKNIVDTGATLNSVTVEIASDGMRADIGPTTDYSPYLELGTQKMPARPFAVPALEAEKSDFTAAVKHVVESGR